MAIPYAEATQFRSLKTLGAGGFGTVDLCQDLATGRLVARKCLQSHLAEGALRQFAREIDETSALDHPNIVKVLYRHYDGAAPFYVMPYFQHGSLRTVFSMAQAEQQVFPPEQAARMVLMLADTLAFAHDRGAIHRDIKPDNVLIADDARPVICDWGLGHFAHRSHGHTLGVIGTPGYAAPEQASGAPIDARVDIHALGILYLELRTGRRDRKATSLLPTGEREIVTHMIRSNPHHRTASMRHVMNEMHTGDVQDPVATFWKGLKVVAGCAAVAAALWLIASSAKSLGRSA
jgi:serine/threonine-protein kinase